MTDLKKARVLIGMIAIWLSASAPTIKAAEPPPPLLILAENQAAPAGTDDTADPEGAVLADPAFSPEPNAAKGPASLLPALPPKPPSALANQAAALLPALPPATAAQSVPTPAPEKETAPAKVTKEAEPAPAPAPPLPVAESAPAPVKDKAVTPPGPVKAAPPTPRESTAQTTPPVPAVETAATAPAPGPASPAVMSGPEVAIILSANHFFPSAIRIKSGQSTRMLFTTVNRRPAALIIDGLQVQRWVANDPQKPADSVTPDENRFHWEINREVSANRITEITLSPATGVYQFHDALSGARGEIQVE